MDPEQGQTPETQDETNDADATVTPAGPYQAAVVAGIADEEGATVVAAVGDETGVQAVGAAITDYADTLIVAEFADADAAKAAYLALQMAELAGEIRVDGVLAVRADGAGRIHVDKMTDHSTKTGLKWGAVGGLAVGILFPPAIIASTVGWGIVGSAVGKMRNMYHQSKVAGELEGAIGPNHSGIVALLHATEAAKAEAKLGDATKVTKAEVDEETAREITAEAKAADAAAADAAGGDAGGAEAAGEEKPA